MNSNQLRASNQAMPLLPTPGQSLLEQQLKLQQQTQRTTLLSNPKAPLLGVPLDAQKPFLGNQQEDLTPPGVANNNRTLLGIIPTSNPSAPKTTKTLLVTPPPGISNNQLRDDSQSKMNKTLLYTPINDDNKHTKTLLSAPGMSNSGNLLNFPTTGGEITHNGVRTLLAAPQSMNINQERGPLIHQSARLPTSLPHPFPPHIMPMSNPSFMTPPPTFAMPAFVPGPFNPGPGPPPQAPMFPGPAPPHSAPLVPAGPQMQSLLDASSYNAMQASVKPQTSTYQIPASTIISTPTSVISSAPVSYDVASSNQPSLFPSASPQKSIESNNTNAGKDTNYLDEKSSKTTLSKGNSSAVGETGLEIAERKFKAILEEEKEFESSCSEWMKQYHTWLKDNENHPNKKQFDTYKSQWTGYIDKMEKKRKEINTKKSSLKADLEKAADEEKRKANTATTQRLKEEQFAMLKHKIDHFKALMKQDNLRIPESVINRLNAASNPNASSTPPSTSNKDTTGPKANSKELSAKKARRRSASISSDSSRSRSRSRSRSHRRSRRRSRSHSSGSSRAYPRRSRDRYRSRSRSRDRRNYRDYDDRYQDRGRDSDYRVIPGTNAAPPVSASSFDTGASEVIDYGHGKALGTRFVPGSKVQTFETWSPNRDNYFDGQDEDHRYNQQEGDFYGAFSTNPRAPHPRAYRPMPGWEHGPMPRFPGPRPPPGFHPRMMRPPPPHMRPRIPFPPHMRGRYPPGVRPPPPQYMMRPPSMQSHDWSDTPRSEYRREPSYYEGPVDPVDYVPSPAPPAPVHYPSALERRDPSPPPPPPPCEVVLLEDLLYPPGREKRPENVFIILRGLPGSGKTTMAKLIKNKELENGGSAPRILNLDDFFTVDGVYEYDSSMKLEYEQNLFKAFKRQIDLGYFPFIILDCINLKAKDFEQYATYARSKCYTTYILELDLDPFTCSHRNIHDWKLDDIKLMEKEWENIHSPFIKVNPNCLLKEIGIEEVEMEDVDLSDVALPSESPVADAENQEDDDDLEDIESIMKKFSASRWDHDTTLEKMERLDGLKKVVHHEDATQNLSEYLQIEDDRTLELNTTGQKRVRWADLEELKLQMKRKQIGFVVGQTDWSKITSEDEDVAKQALNRTKYFQSDVSDN